MRAVVLDGFGDPDVLAVRAVERPEPQAGEVRVRVRAAFVAPTRDGRVRAGTHPVLSRFVTFPHILGGEHAGTVDAVSPDVPEELLGSRVAVSARIACGGCPACRAGNSARCAGPLVIGIHRDGSNAEFVVVPTENLEPIPDGLSFAQAAVLGGNGPLAHAQLEAAGVGPGRRVLVPGASGSVGSVLVGLAARRGARVIALARRPEAAKPLLALGAERVLDTAREDLGEALREHAPDGLDAVIDNLGLVDLWKRYEPLLAPFARVVVSGRVADWGKPFPVDVGQLYPLGQALIGVRGGNAAQNVVDFWAYARANGFSTPEELIEAFPLERAADAHRSIEAGAKLGHYVLTMD